MPRLKANYNDNGRLTLLQKTLETAKSDQAAGNAWLSEELTEEIKNFLPGWEEKNQALSEFKSKKEKEIREKNLSVEFLDIVMRDFWAVLKRRVNRRNEPAEVLTFYQLPLSGALPNVRREEEIFAYASKMIEGDSKAVKAGYKPMQNPDAKELSEALQNARKEMSEVVPADRAYDEAQEAIEALRPEADKLIKDVIAELRFNLRKKDPAKSAQNYAGLWCEI